MMARTGPEGKRLLLAALAGYLLCVWQALCVAPPWPALSQPRRPDLLDMAGPGANPALARKLSLEQFSACPLTPGEVRAAIQWDSVRLPVDFTAQHPDDPDAWSRMAALSLWGKSRAVQRPTPTYTLSCVIPVPRPAARTTLQGPPGHLAARFESGPGGAATVGHTASAGTSYGTFQIASGTPTYANFMRYLQERAPDLHARLTGRGPANTGGTAGTVPDEWRRIATEHPVRFARLQYDFILSTHYRPAAQSILEQTGVDFTALSPAVREVLLSTAVQHGAGGAIAIFSQAIEAIKPRVVEERRLVHFEKALIEEVYRLRLRSWGDGPPSGRGAMASRYGREKSQALTLLDRHYSGT
ncbi:hypothetical protein NNJEOMEG_03267 [Fundidesulfovibrio magnetotacticus]|uniref:Type VI secretion system spike protein VgrG3-like C-terminal domain-containing protein n=1 Tax=Fundidesulfovibrio magnetotacticus TaxID=2730080 RepID=A0A6V8LUJ4_9BACT|nr:hypothetical protein [Fundidesulfovibrio magnetotacticus]GFK95404.1 hypothetical protein NNJEOMEG_03267 [Fundidesulfovibrio magnetotacticus]